MLHSPFSGGPGSLQCRQRPTPAADSGAIMLQQRILRFNVSGHQATSRCRQSASLGFSLHGSQMKATNKLSLVAHFRAQDDKEAAPASPEVVSGKHNMPADCHSRSRSSNAAATSAAADSPASNTTSRHNNSSSPKEQARLIRRLLQLSTISSTDSVDGDALPTPQQLQQQIQDSRSETSVQQEQLWQQQQQAHRSLPQPQPQQQQRVQLPFSLMLRPSETQVGSLYDDASAEDYDPILLDMMGFKSVAQYLQYKVDLAVMQTKVDLLHAAVWLSLGSGFINAMGGFSAYQDYVRLVTENGAASDNLTFVWLFLLGYYTVKSCMMSVATGWRSWMAKGTEEDMIQVLELEVPKEHQRLAYWMLQERLLRYENRANRTYAEFALASLLLGVLLLMQGGEDTFQLQLDTVNQGALSGLLVMLWLFWESYFSTIAALVQVVQLGTAWVNKLQHKQKWERE